MSYHDMLGDIPETPIGHDFDLTRPVESFIPTARAVAFQPVAFFAAIPRQKGFANPLVFAIICAEVAAIIGGVLALTGGRGVAFLVSSVVATAIGAAVGSFIIAGIAHLLVMWIIGPTNAGFEATFRTVTYASVTELVSWIPLIGGLLSLYGIYLAIIGIREVHQTTTGKAATVVLIPVAVIGVLILLSLAVVGLAMFGALGGLR